MEKLMTNLSDEVILKAGIQLHLLKIHCISSSKHPEISKVNIHHKKFGKFGRCTCLTSKLQTELCRKFYIKTDSKTNLENELYKLIPMSTLNKDEGNPSAVSADSENVNDNGIKITNVEKKTILDHQASNSRLKQESKAIIQNNQQNSKNKLLEVLENYTHNHGCAWSYLSNMDLIYTRSRKDFVHICNVIDAKSTTQFIVCTFIEKEGTKVFCKNINVADWNVKDGTLIAIGTHDGFAQVWKTDGKKAKCLRTLIQHKGPIFALKWNKKGNYIVSGSSDGTSIVWDSSGQVVQQFAFHSQPILCVDWNTKRSFASSGIDRNIYVCRIGENQPIQTFQGHEDSVPSIQWDPQGQRLVSYSADQSIRVWSLKQSACIHILQGHSDIIKSVIWSPTGPGSNNPHLKSVIASASSDSTIRLWDAQSGDCITTFSDHEGPVTCLTFSPDGLFLVSGGIDMFVRVFSTQKYSEICSFEGMNRIAGVHWNPMRKTIGAITYEGSVCLLDVQKIYMLAI